MLAPGFMNSVYDVNYIPLSHVHVTYSMITLSQMYGNVNGPRLCYVKDGAPDVLELGKLS